MPFRPEEVLFSPTADCNLSCPHCVTSDASANKTLSVTRAIKFLDECAGLGVKRVGFTGGEPFLREDFLRSVVGAAVARGMLFDRVMTNGVWWTGRRELRKSLERLRDCGYDGDICVSVDAFHDQGLGKVAVFIKTAAAVWRRPDVVSIAYVSGALDEDTSAILKRLAKILKARIRMSCALRPYMKSRTLFVKTNEIALAPVGRAGALKPAWGARWFKDDNCRGPGNVFMVMPNGDVKPCCGYASDHDGLTIGNIMRDSARKILRGAGRNRFVRTVFDSGLGRIRKRLERSGVAFPGKTDSHCAFCAYILTHISKRRLAGCLDR